VARIRRAAEHPELHRRRADTHPAEVPGAEVLGAEVPEAEVPEAVPVGTRCPAERRHRGKAADLKWGRSEWSRFVLFNQSGGLRA